MLLNIQNQNVNQFFVNLQRFRYQNNFSQTREQVNSKLHKNIKMFRSIMLASSLVRFNFAKFLINQSNFESLKKQFSQRPETSTFGSYFTYDNAMQIFSIVTQAKQLQRTHRIAILNEIQAMCQNQQSHKANSDEGLNLLANIHFHKSMQLSLMGNFQLNIKQLEAAIAIIQIMQYPDYFFLGQLQRSRGQAYLRLNALAKSQHALLKAQSYLKQMLDDFLQQQGEESITKQNKNALKVQISKTRVALAHTLSQLANSYIKQSKIYQSKSQVQKAIQTWEYVANYRGIPYYELTIRIKSLLHLMFNQRGDALQSSNSLLEYLEDPKTHKIYRSPEQINLAKIWHMNFIVSNYKQQNQSMYLLMKEKWEKRLIQLIKQSKEGFKPNEFQNIIKSTGLTEKKLAKYGLL